MNYATSVHKQTDVVKAIRIRYCVITLKIIYICCELTETH